ncbi:MFS transporter [Paraburkholderia sediminicola]|uniref:spinster family MFS transporter n=1 Tax=Paraburkholderia sediminicola TaxID=458836 RepID=UPI000EB342EC
MNDVVSPPDVALTGRLTGYKTKPYRAWVLFILLVVYTLSNADRSLLTVFAQPIISTFHLTDSQWGLLSGPPFAMFYALMGLPLAVWADRSKRVVILAFCILMWSITTTLCGFASGFLILLVCRMGVAIGEAGCSPISNSLLADYFIPIERPKVLSIWALGVTIGIIAANIFGGAIAGLYDATSGHGGNGMGLPHLFSGVLGFHVEGWRLAFMLLGALGLLVASVVYFSVKEPPRGYSDPPTSMKWEAHSFASSLKELLSKRSYWWMTLASFQATLVMYGVISFQAPLLQRLHGLTVGQAALQFGFPIAVAGSFGTFFCGWLVEKLTLRYFSSVAWVPAIGVAVAVPFYLVAFRSTNLGEVRIFWLLAAFFHYFVIGSAYAIGQGVVSSRSRAVAIAVLLFIVSGLGGSTGPYLLGVMSDALTLWHFHASSAVAGLSPHLCKMQSNLTEAQIQACHLASSYGLRDAISLMVGILIPASLCLVICARRLKRDYLLQTKN